MTNEALEDFEVTKPNVAQLLDNLLLCLNSAHEMVILAIDGKLVSYVHVENYMENAMLLLQHVNHSGVTIQRSLEDLLKVDWNELLKEL